MEHEAQSPEPQEAPSLIGTVISQRFRVLERIAVGGMGTVYRAEQIPLGRTVALKVMRAPAEDTFEVAFRQRFFLEAAEVAKLKHPNTVVVHDYGSEGNSIFYIAMEFIEGRTLANECEQLGAVDVIRAIHIALQVAGSLREAHEMGLVHRDLKPGNVMLTTRGSEPDFVKVLDFGLVKVVRDESDENGDLTKSGMMLGSPKFMAPEQIQGRKVDHRCDIYSFGALLFMMLTGRPPFVGETQFQVLTAHVRNAPPTIRELLPNCPVTEGLEQLVSACLAKDRAARPQTMDEVLAVLHAEFNVLAPGLRSGVSSSSFPREALSASGSLSAPLPLSGSFRQQPAGPITASYPSVPAAATPQPAIQSGASSDSGSPVPHLPPNHEPRTSTVPWTTVMLLLALVAVLAAIFTVISTPASPPTSAAAPRSLPVERSVVDLADPVALHSTPSATVRHDGSDLGDTPIQLPIPAGETWTLELSAPGHAPRTIVVTAGQNQVQVGLNPLPPPPPPPPARQPTPSQAAQPTSPQQDDDASSTSRRGPNRPYRHALRGRNDHNPPRVATPEPVPAADPPAPAESPAPAEPVQAPPPVPASRSDESNNRAWPPAHGDNLDPWSR